MIKSFSRYLFLLALMLTATDRLGAQFYLTGNEPPGIKWKYFTTENFKIIYPEGTDSLAKKYAELFETHRGRFGYIKSVNKRTFPIILHPYSVYSNGMVVWAPRRAELITIPQARDGYAQSWDVQLSLHEQRHIVQIQKFEKGIFAPLKYIGGEQMAGLGAGLYTAGWELEGDAVISETKLSNYGRGRDPEFLMFYKASMLSGESRTFHQWALGSAAKYEPDRYAFGYMFLNGTEKISGRNVFDGIVDYRLRHPFNLNGSNDSYREISGYKTKKRLFGAIRSNLVAGWRAEDSLSVPYPDYRQIVRTRGVYENYSSLAPGQDGKLYAVRSSLDDITEVGIIDPAGKFIKLTNAGDINSRLASSGKYLYWTENVPSPRWEKLSYSVPVKFNTETGEKSWLAIRSRFFNPSPSGDTSLFVTEYTPEGKSAIVQIDLTGKIIKRVICPEDGQIKESAVSGDTIYFTLVRNYSVYLMSYMAGTGRFEKLTGLSGRNIRNISLSKGRILFESELDGRYNCYEFDPEKREYFKLTNARFGAFSPIRGENGVLLFTNYSKSGYLPSIATEGQILNLKTDIPEQFKITNMVEEKSEAKIKKSGDFPFIGNFLKIHSWAPIYFDAGSLLTESMTIDNLPVKPGVMIMSQDLTGKLAVTAGCSFANGKGAGHLNLTYRGVLPVIEVNANVNEKNALDFYTFVTDDNRIRVGDSLSGRPYASVELRSYIPLNFSRAGRIRWLIPSFIWNFSNTRYTNVLTSDEGLYNRIILALRYYNVKNLAKRNIYPENGFGLYLRYSEVLGTDKYFGRLFGFNGYVYLPGITVNHGFKISGSYQKQFVSGRYFFQDNFQTFVRGYDPYAEQISALSVNYVFPVYIHQTKGEGILYFKRLKINPFYDGAYLLNHSARNFIYSYGAEFQADFNILGISYPFSGGVRIGYTKDGRAVSALLFTMSL
jgi:hypothetical protein